MKKKKYSETECKEKFNSAIKNPQTLYQQDFVNWKGKATNGRYYADIISELLLKNIEKLNEIPMIDRARGYLSQHRNNLQRVNGSNRREERKVIGFNGKNIGELGKVIDYQIPLRDNQRDRAGKIDFISVNDNYAYLTEFKYESEESLLKAVLEIYTYAKIINLERLINELEKKLKIKDIKIQTAILFDVNSSFMYEQYKNLTDMPFLKKLIEKLQVEVYILTEIAINAFDL